MTAPTPEVFEAMCLDNEQRATRLSLADQLAELRRDVLLLQLGLSAATSALERMADLLERQP